MLTMQLLDLAHAKDWPVPEAQRTRMLDALDAMLQGRLSAQDWAPRNDLEPRQLAAQATLVEHGRAKIVVRPKALDALSAQSLVDWSRTLMAMPTDAERDAALKDAGAQLRSRFDVQGTRLRWRDESGPALVVVHVERRQHRRAHGAARAAMGADRRGVEGRCAAHHAGPGRPAGRGPLEHHHRQRVEHGGAAPLPAAVRGGPGRWRHACHAGPHHARCDMVERQVRLHHHRRRHGGLPAGQPPERRRVQARAADRGGPQGRLPLDPHPGGLPVLHRQPAHRLAVTTPSPTPASTAARCAIRAARRWAAAPASTA
jgi:hypothetical protein